MIPFSEIESSKASSEVPSAQPAVQYSSKTQALLARIKGDKKAQPEEKKAISISLVAEPDISMRSKHQDLLSVTRRIVIPSKYRVLIDMSNFIDVSLNFLRSRKENGEPFIPFRDVQKSISITQKKTLTLKMFK